MFDKSNSIRKVTILGLILLAFCIACRFFTHIADIYALHIYPAVSCTLSLVGALFPFSLEELVVSGFVAAIVLIAIQAIRRRKRFIVWLEKTLVVLMWCLVWFYMGWGNNYYRTNLYLRCGIQQVSYDRETFRRFLNDYTVKLNDAAKEAGTYGKEPLETDAKLFYSDVASQYGYATLHPWQHIKKPVFNRLFSAVSISGYMGPFFCEAQVNGDVSEAYYPYVMAHELAHLAGVTSEAEASYWAFDFCRQSDDKAVRYSGFLSLFPYVLTHAKAFLNEEEYAAWTTTVCDKAKEDFTANQAYWQEKRVPWIARIQKWMQDGMLHSNGVSQGVSDYFGVISIVITMDAAAGVNLATVRLNVSPGSQADPLGRYQPSLSGPKRPNLCQNSIDRRFWAQKQQIICPGGSNLNAYFRRSR